jgi:hypothetical protein
MGKARFLYDNLIAGEDSITVSSLRAGTVTSAQKEGAGSAVITVSGDYTGAVDKEYIVEIDSIAGGAEVGQATFRWSDGGGTWDGTAVPTAGSSILLNNGVYVKWASGSGADFVVGDKWYFKCINLFNAGKMIDLDRDHRYRSASAVDPVQIVIDLGSPKDIRALTLWDHNLTAAATITIAGNSSGDLSYPEMNQVIPWQAGNILYYLVQAWAGQDSITQWGSGSQWDSGIQWDIAAQSPGGVIPTTFRYWQITISDPSNPDGFIEVGELGLYNYMELSRNYKDGFDMSYKLLVDSNVTPYGKRTKRFYNRQRLFSFDFNAMGDADRVLLLNMADTISMRSTGQLKPFFFDSNPDVPGSAWLVDIFELPDKHRSGRFYEISLQFEEVMKSI